jgi:hypothetical protein
MLERFIAELSKELGLEKELVPSAPGVYVIPVNDEITMEVASIPEGFSLRSTIVAAPEMRQDEFFLHMMLANLFGQGTMGSVLGLNEEGNRLIVTRVLERDISYRDFRDAVEDFMNSIDFWREEALNYS